MNSMNRRKFLKALGAGGLVYAFGRTSGTVWAQTASVDGFADYKALVCVYLTGGNDSWNMVVPRSDAEYGAYARSRQNLAVPQSSLLPIDLQNSGDAAYGLHPKMLGIQSLVQGGSCAVLANVGPLVEPVTKDDYLQGGGHLPPQLFSHNDQQAQWHSLRGRNPSRTGWAGRIADLLASQLTGQKIPMNVSLAGNSLFQAGERAIPYILGSSGAKKFTGFGTSGTALARQNAFQRIAGFDQPTAYGRAFAEVELRTLAYAKLVNDSLAKAPALAAVFPTSELGTQLKTVARVIAVRQLLGMSRQIFFVAVGGFDTHSEQLANQPLLLGDLSASLSAFHAATVELGVAPSVTTFTESDFARTLTSNRDGSDHAWGGVQLVVGGAVAGQAMYGEYPVLELGAANDIGGGRLIPTTASDQYAATLARWFGVADANIPLVAPNIDNFATRDLGFLV